MLLELNRTSQVPYCILLLKSVDGTRALFSFVSRMTDSCFPHEAIKEGLLKIPIIGCQKTR